MDLMFIASNSIEAMNETFLRSGDDDKQYVRSKKIQLKICYKLNSFYTKILSTYDSDIDS